MTSAPFVRPGVTLALHDSDRRGVPFLFQHGLCGNAAQTAEVMPVVPGLRRLTLECRGHGASTAGKLSDLSIASFADDVAAVIDSQGLAPAILGGISMGAAIASRLAVNRPEAVRALVLARPAWVTEPAPNNLRPYREVGALLARLPAATAYAAFLASSTAQNLLAESPDNVASLLGIIDQATPVTAELLNRIAGDGPGVSRSELGRISCPTLVIGHGQDLAHPFTACEELAALIPGAKLVRITSKSQDKAAYVLEFQAALTAFLEDIVDGTT